MDSAGTLSRPVVPDSANPLRLPGTSTAILFVLLTAALSALAVWLLDARLSDARSLSLWAKIITVRDAPALRLEYLGVVYPHLPAYLLMLLRLVPGLDSPLLPHLMSAAIVAGVLALWARELAPRSSPVLLAVTLSLIVAHPFTLWTATTAPQWALGLGLFYLLLRQFVLLQDDDSPHYYLRIGVLLALLFFTDERATYVAIALVLLLPLITPGVLLQRAPFSFYLVVFTPFVFCFGAWAYVNWIYFDDPLLFLKAPDSAFLGARAEYAFTPWLLQWGGQFLAPLAIIAALGVVAFPAALLLVDRAWRSREYRRVGIVAIGLPVIAGALATLHETLAHPVTIAGLLLASVLIGFSLWQARTAVLRWTAVLLFALGTLGGWGIFLWNPSPAMTDWLRALQHDVRADRYASARALGLWMREERMPTLIDDSATYAAIVARGDARELVLPYSDAFKVALRRDQPTHPQVVVADPRSAAGARDAIARRYPDLYDEGLPGYRRVFDARPWRVYRRIDVR